MNKPVFYAILLVVLILGLVDWAAVSAQEKDDARPVLEQLNALPIADAAATAREQADGWGALASRLAQQRDAVTQEERAAIASDTAAWAAKHTLKFVEATEKPEGDVH